MLNMIVIYPGHNQSCSIGKFLCTDEPISCINSKHPFLPFLEKSNTIRSKQASYIEYINIKKPEKINFRQS
ncbi:hypothetical protein B4Q04_04525 [Zobellia sp. OII3]|nr:hypothetical protein B4Q04_04525 [Zobellia sp. OII3]